MKPMPGKIYAGRSGKPREVIAVVGLSESGQSFDVIYQPVLSGGRRGSERSCWCATWEAWVTGPIEEHQA